MIAILVGNKVHVSEGEYVGVQEQEEDAFQGAAMFLPAGVATIFGPVNHDHELEMWESDDECELGVDKRVDS